MSEQPLSQPESQLDRMEQLLRELHRDFRGLKQKVADLERRLAFGQEPA